MRAKRKNNKTSHQRQQIKTKKKKKSNLLWNLIIIIGLLICSYPIYSNLSNYKDQYDAIHSYQKEVKHTKTADLSSMIKEAKEYNEVLYNYQKTGLADEKLSSKNYKKLLSLNGAKTIGTLEIPSINVNLPIYHGTSESVLNVAVGHLSSSSLPVGSKNTRAVLTGHRGLPSSKLFTRLDELKKGDLFYVKVGNKTLAYKVYKIETILPTEVEKLSVEDGKDEVSLVTCTPYGINTHRLVVTGKRTKYIPEVKDGIKRKIPSIRECAFTLIPILLIIYFVYSSISKKKKKARKQSLSSRNRQ